MTEIIKVPSNVLLDIDALLDTRLAIASEILQTEEELQNLLRGGYTKRELHVPNGVDSDRFKSIWKERNVRHLAQSVRTRIPDLIREILTSGMKRSMSVDYIDIPQIHLNFWPYKLEPEETETIIDSVDKLFLNKYKIIGVNLSDQAIGPNLLKSNYEFFIKYDYPAWLDAQANAFKDNHCREVRMIVPAIYFNRKFTQQEIKSFAFNWAKENPLLLCLLGCINAIELELVPVELFSIAL